MSDPREPGRPLEKPPGQTPWRPWLRALAGALLLAAVLLFVAWGIYRGAVHAPAAERREAQLAPRRPALTAVSVSAPAERGRGGDWSPLEAGADLREDEEVRTGPGGAAELSAGERARVAIAERTRLSVRELGDDLHAYGLAHGRVLVDYEGDDARAVRIDGAGGASAVARGARFVVASDGLVFAVATETGRVDLSAAGAAVSVEAGFQAVARDGGAPSAARPVPKEVLLELARASRAPPGARCLESSGRTDPAASVTVNGVLVRVDEEGRFPLRVDRAGGAPVEIVATLPDGRTATRTVPCARASDARVREIEVRWREP